MLNKYIYSLIVIMPLIISACSVTPEGIQSDTDEVSTENRILSKAVSAMKSGNTKKARIILTKVIKQHPNLSNAHVNLGIIHINNKHFSKAKVSLEKALKINPKNIYALNQIGFLYRKKGEFYKAQSSYEKAININSNYAFAHLNLGILFDLYLYDLESAIEHYKIYNEITKDKNSMVKKWIFDLERRLKKSLAQK